MAKYKLPRGTYDILPDQAPAWQFVEQTWRQVACLYGYQQIVTPIFESAELFERSSGDTSDVVSKEMYRFTDKKGRVFALRPEGTAPVVRSYVQNDLGHNGTTRLYYTGPMFRYDRPQKGRYRQFYQFGAEILGSAHPYVDAELISLASLFLRKLGLNNIQLEINSLGNPASMEGYNQALRDYFNPHADELCADCRQRLEKNPKRLLDCKVESCKTIAADAPVMINYLDDEAKAHFDSVCAYLTDMGITYKVNPQIVRGLDYYTHTAFEFLNNDLGAQNAVIAGGRYNGLVKELGGKEVSAIGFAGGFERLLASLEAANLLPEPDNAPTAYLVTMGQAAAAKAPQLVYNLRQQGVALAWDAEKGSAKSQFKAADKCNATYALVIGDDELAKGVVSVRNLADGNQTELPIAQVAEYLDKSSKKS